MFPRKSFLPVAAASVLFAGLVSPAAKAETDKSFQDFLVEFKAYAMTQGVREATIDAAFRDAQPFRRIVKRDRNQAEFKLTLKTYLNRVVTKRNIQVGRAKYRKHMDLLKRVEAKYGVQPRFILSHWGLETRYGAVKADVPLISAVATLAHDKRRSKFFRNELLAALRMLDKGHIELENMKGSWAGAMGQPQFIPSSYLEYAVDFDGDGRRDIWNSEADVFASIANYLARHGWHNDQTWGRQVRIPATATFRDSLKPGNRKSGCRAIRNMTAARSLPDWQAAGVRKADGSNLPTRNLSATLVEPDGPTGPAYLVYRNYHSILRYNCAHLYGITIGTLADRLANP